ncbi:MAG TPA: hypothetical protein VF680_17770 [Allosphingosinicella sp.]|jgi:hypothetical protein
MFRPIIAALLLAFPTGAAFAQAAETGNWVVGTMLNGCMVQAVSPEGTMLSVWGVAGDEKLGFLLQNKGWNALRDGARYDLKLDFLGVSSLPVKATARRDIDSDGPGFYFQLQPGGSRGKAFMDAFSTAQGMRISQAGKKVDTLSLAGSKDAMSALARCLADKWAEAPDAEPAQPAEAPTGDAPAVI